MILRRLLHTDPSSPLLTCLDEAGKAGPPCATLLSSPSPVNRRTPASGL